MAQPTVYTHEYQVLDALARRFPDPEWCFLHHVHSATGFDQRQADALALNLWSSRGHELYGFEVKCQRADLLKELKDPAKSHKIAKFCDRWYLVLGDKKLIKNSDIIPPTWGIIIPRGKTMAIVRKAEKLKPEKWNRSFIAAIFRRVQEQKMNKKELRQEHRKGYEEGYAAGKDAAKTQRGTAEHHLSVLQQKVKAFEEASGVSLGTFWPGERIGRAVSDVLNGRHLSVLHQLESGRDNIKDALKLLDRLIRTVEGGIKNG